MSEAGGPNTARRPERGTEKPGAATLMVVVVSGALGKCWMSLCGDQKCGGCLGRLTAVLRGGRW